MSARAPNEIKKKHESFSYVYSRKITIIKMVKMWVILWLWESAAISFRPAWRWMNGRVVDRRSTLFANPFKTRKGVKFYTIIVWNLSKGMIKRNLMRSEKSPAFIIYSYTIECRLGFPLTSSIEMSSHFTRFVPLSSLCWPLKPFIAKRFGRCDGEPASKKA